LVTGRYGWRAEAGFTMIGRLGPSLGYEAVTFATVPIALAVCYYAHMNGPVVAEVAMLVYSLISIGNVILFFAPNLGSAWNVAVFTLVPAIYLSRGLKPVWFDRSPTRDDLLEDYRCLKRWKQRFLKGGTGAV